MGLVLELPEPCKSCSNGDNRTFCLPCDGYKKWVGKQQAAKAQASHMGKEIMKFAKAHEDTLGFAPHSVFWEKWLKREGIEV